tara:strand:+ start:136 stop:285 length:150 start_codon:yes stop_codon:yes gene_type:complete
MEELKKYKLDKLETVGHPKPNWLQKPKVKPRIWITKESLKYLKTKNYGK